MHELVPFQAAHDAARSRAFATSPGASTRMSYFPDTASGLSIAGFPDAGALALSDTDIITRAGVDYSARLSALATLSRLTAPGSRTASLLTTLTADDNDRNVVLTGTSGTLAIDAAVADGFRCHVVNTGSGGVSLQNLQAIPAAWSTLASGASALVMVVGNVAYAALSSGYPPSAATALPIDAATFAGVL
jgi:hypothetical protein